MLQTRVVHGYGEGPDQPLAGYGYDKYKKWYLGVDGRGSRDPSPSRPAQEQRDMAYPGWIDEAFDAVSNKNWV